MNGDAAASASTLLGAVDVGIAVDISFAKIVWYQHHGVAIVVVCFVVSVGPVAFAFRWTAPTAAAVAHRAVVLVAGDGDQAVVVAGGAALAVRVDQAVGVVQVLADV